MVDGTKDIQCFPESCGSCGSVGETQVLNLEYDNMPAEIISVFACSNCGERSSLYFEKENYVRDKLKISCSFNDIADLQRFLYLAEGSKVFFYYNNQLIYDYKSTVSEITVFEMMLTKAIMKIAEISNINPTESLIWEQNKQNVNLSSEKINAFNVIDRFKEMRDGGKIKVVVTDKTGRSRVGLRDQQTPEGLNSKEVIELEDECVTYQYV